MCFINGYFDPKLLGDRMLNRCRITKEPGTLDEIEDRLMRRQNPHRQGGRSIAPSLTGVLLPYHRLLSTYALPGYALSPITEPDWTFKFMHNLFIVSWQYERTRMNIHPIENSIDINWVVEHFSVGRRYASCTCTYERAVLQIGNSIAPLRRFRQEQYIDFVRIQGTQTTSPISTPDHLHHGRLISRSRSVST